MQVVEATDPEDQSLDDNDQDVDQGSQYNGADAEMSPEDADRILEEVKETGAAIQSVQEAVGEAVFGQEEVIDQVLMTLLCGGHALLVGVPGLAKTLLVDTLSTVMGLEAKRIQFTPDLMPGDILGSEVLEEGEDGKRAFRFIKGPVFTQLLMADEITRASPRTQSALLQAMQERHVTIAGERHDLPQPFHVLATQNPLEQEGTYPLPEAQLDRFLMQIDVGYPHYDAERRMLLATTGSGSAAVRAVLDPERLMKAQALVRRMPVGEDVLDGILTLVRNARPGQSALDNVEEHVAWGPGPRASQALMLGVRARALMDGRFAPSLDDVAAIAHPVLRHRMALSYTALNEGRTVGEAIDVLIGTIG